MNIREYARFMCEGGLGGMGERGGGGGSYLYIYIYIYIGIYSFSVYISKNRFIDRLGLA